MLVEFRERVEDEFPQLTEYYNSVSGLYLNVMPKRLRDQILDIKVDDSSSTSTSTQTNVENASNLTNSTIVAAAAADATASTTTAQPQSNSTPKK